MGALDKENFFGPGQPLKPTPCACAAVPGGPNNCPDGCKRKSGTTTTVLNFKDGTATVDGENVTMRAALVNAGMATDSTTRISMLREMHTEATQDLELAVAEQRPNAVYEHGEAVAALEEIINYIETNHS